MKVVDDAPRSAAELLLSSTLDELARRGALRMLNAALEAEVAAYLARHAGARDEAGHALVVRNGHARPRQVTLGCGTVEVSAPRVSDRRVDGTSSPCPHSAIFSAASPPSLGSGPA